MIGLGELISLRLPENLMKSADDLAKKLSEKERYRSPFTRSEIIRSALERGLIILGNELKPADKPPAKKPPQKKRQ